MLKTLKQEAKITEAILRVSDPPYTVICRKGLILTRLFRKESKAGLAVGKLRSHASKEVADLAKEIVKKWKTEVDKEKQAKGGDAKPTTKATPMRKASTASTTASSATPSAPSRAPSTPITPTATSAVNSLAAGKGEVRTTKTDGVSTNVSGDKTRDKCIEIIYDALASDSGARRFHRCLALFD